jgi:putative ABC transport system permease protein
LRPAADALIDVGDQHVSVRTELATPSLFPTLGINPVSGRGFGPNGDADRAPVVLLSKRIADRLLRSGREGSRFVTVDGAASEVVGIIPDELTAVTDADMLLPFYPSPGRTRPHVLRVVARLTGEDSTRYLSQMLTTALHDRRSTLVVRPFRIADPAVAANLVAMAVAAGALFLVTWLSLVSLQLATALARRADFAVCVALGAAPSRLLMIVMLETVTLNAGAWLLGALFSRIGVRGLGNMPFLANSIALPTSPGAGGLALSAALALAVSVVAPAALIAAYGAGRRSSASRSYTGSLNIVSVLLGAHSAAVIVLLALSACALATSISLSRGSPGFDATSRVILVTVKAASVASHGEPAAQASTIQRLHTLLAGLPDVEAAGTVNSAPLGGPLYGASVLSGPGGSEQVQVQLRFVSDDYFEAMGIPLLDGRAFPKAQAARIPDTIISAAAARKLWGSAPSVGRSLFWVESGQTLSVRAVVGDVRHQALDAPAEAVVYLSAFDFGSSGDMTAVLRTSKSNAISPAQLERVVTSSGLPLAVNSVRSAADQLALAVAPQRTVTLVLLIVVTLAACVSVVGVVGLSSLTASQRRRECGVRVALGATTSRVVSLLVRRIVWICAAAIVSGGLLTAVVLRSALSAGLVSVIPPWPVFALGGFMYCATLIGAGLPAALRCAKQSLGTLLRA